MEMFFAIKTLARIFHEGGTDAWKLMIVNGLRLTAEKQSVPKHVLRQFGFGFSAKTPKP
jgi:hypothetical protein